MIIKLSNVLPYCNDDTDDISKKLNNIIEISDFNTSLKSLNCFDHIRELINVLKVIGKQIQILILRCVQNHEFDPDIFHELCPELVELRFNEKLF